MSFISWSSWHASQATVDREIQAAATERIFETRTELKQKLDSYEQILTGGAGLIRGSSTVTDFEWRNYAETYRISDRYPGIQGYGYIKAFTASDLPAIVQSMQDQVIEFSLSPDTPRDFYTAVLYVYPDNSSNAVGRDLYTELSYRQAMSHARETGATTITPALKPIDTDTNQSVLFIFVPQYQSGAALDTPEQRNKALQGYVFARLKSKDFFNDLIKSASLGKNTEVQINAPELHGKSAILFASQNYEQNSKKDNTIINTQIVSVFGQNWELKFVFAPQDLISAQRLDTPLRNAFISALIAILLSQVVYLLARAKSKELSMQKDAAVNLAKDELLSLASHQLRTPATSVKQYLGMVIQGFAGDITPTQSALLDKAYAGNERQLYIINEMLHVAKIDSGRIVLALHKTNINNLIEDIVHDAANDAEELNHLIKLKLPKKSIIIEVDEYMLRMSLENLVSNAIKYTLPAGKITIKLSYQNNVASIVVADTGIGIEQKDITQLFKLFTRLDNPLTRHVGGTGVGLYLAKHLIELHGGNLDVASKPGKGSTFTISLPTIR